MDFTHTNNFKGLHLYKNIAGEESIPSYINKVTPVDGVEVYEKLASSSFADVSNREYPINNKANTWLSALYFLTDSNAETKKFASQFSKDKIWANIQLAAEMHGIGEDIETMSNILVQGLTKKASEINIESKECKYALQLENNDEIINYFPINTFEQIKTAAFELNKNFNNIPLPLIKEASENIYKELTTKFAKEYKKEPYVLSKNLVDLAEQRIIDSDKLVKMANDRYELTKDSSYLDIAKFATENSDNFDQLKEAVDLVCEIDLQNGLSNYSSTLNPYAMTASTLTVDDTVKMAKAYVELNDTVIPFVILKQANVLEGVQAILGHSKSASFIEAVKSSEDAIELANSGEIEKLDKDQKNDIIRVAVLRG
jgi:hypothetical protein